MKKKLLILWMALSMIFLCVPAFSAEITLDEDKLKDMIKEVIRDNPELLYNTINAYVLDLRKQNEERQFQASLENRVAYAVGKNSPVKGDPDAPITLIEYTDFECPYCSNSSQTVDSIMKKYDGRIKVVFKNNPLDFHKMAMPAAKAALAAHKQGKFWEYHDRLFANTSNLNEDLFIAIAEELEMDMEQFEMDRESEAVADQIGEEMAEADAVKITGTPSFIVNGIIIRGAKSLEYFSRVIDHLLNEIKQKK